MSATKKACICSFCIAFCYILPLAFHGLGLGPVFSPMHLPVLLCGALCGWPYGAFCGVAGPVISCVLSGMPAPTQLIYMVPELMVYGLVTGMAYALIHTGRTGADLVLSLLPAMAAGRIVGGTAQAAFYLSTAREYSLALWAAGYLVGNAPGAVMQLILIPILVLTLGKARHIPPRYPKQGGSL